MRKILVIHGPNINLLGTREVGVYGKENLDTLNAYISGKAAQLDLICDIRQSNIEGDIINHIHNAIGVYNGIILNAGAYTHYSYAIRDAIAAVRIPCVEVHISNVFSREQFRHVSVIAPVCVGSVSGFGKYSYYMALVGLSEIIKA